jgi:DNA-binding MarR family transcriptional regulator
MSHSQILSFIGASGIRISDLARIHEVGRQTLSATARDLVALGYLRRELDPNDRRGALLFLTDRGVRLVRDSIVELHKLERRVEQILGRRLLRQFLAVAEELHAALDAGDDIFDLPAARSSTRASGRSKRDENDLVRLAARLQHELGPRRSVRLAELLQDLQNLQAETAR